MNVAPIAGTFHHRVDELPYTQRCRAYRRTRGVTSPRRERAGLADDPRQQAHREAQRADTHRHDTNITPLLPTALLRANQFLASTRDNFTVSDSGFGHRHGSLAPAPPTAKACRACGGFGSLCRTPRSRYPSRAEMTFPGIAGGGYTLGRLFGYRQRLIHLLNTDQPFDADPGRIGVRYAHTRASPRHENPSTIAGVSGGFPVIALAPSNTLTGTPNLGHVSPNDPHGAQG